VTTGAPLSRHSSPTWVLVLVPIIPSTVLTLMAPMRRTTAAGPRGTSNGTTDAVPDKPSLALYSANQPEAWTVTLISLLRTCRCRMFSCRFRQGQTISSVGEPTAARFESAWTLLPEGIVVEPSSQWEAWLLIATSITVSRVADSLPVGSVVMALMGFQQFTRLFYGSQAATGTSEIVIPAIGSDRHPCPLFIPVS
jgi:hypothetical protein